MTDEASCIVLNQVNKFFDDKQVLKDVNLKVPRGCIYGLLGPSGCGKTTTVKIMSGILEATTGEAFVLGEKMPQLAMMSRIGYMAQSDALYTAMSAYENLEFFASLYDMKKPLIKERIDEVISLINLRDYLHEPVSVYSGGMKRRLSLAMALIHQPQVLILDEPTVGIDPLLRKDIWGKLNQMAAAGVTIIITTHVMDEADKCSRLAMMRNGRIIAEGTPYELQKKINAKDIEEAFIYYGGGTDEG